VAKNRSTVGTPLGKFEDDCLKILIAFPCGGDVNPWFMHSVTMSMLALYAAPPCTLQQALMFEQSSILPANREGIAEAATERADVLITLDTDVRFHPSVFPRLIQHFLDGKRVVAGNYVRRVEPWCPTAHADGKCVYQGEGLQKVDHVGMGLVMLDTGIFDEINKPWFNFSYDEEKGWRGEDINFFQKVRDAGIDVWIDHQIGVTHIGDMEYDMAFGEAFREESE
jgi:hypothetical protein